MEIDAEALKAARLAFDTSLHHGVGANLEETKMNALSAAIRAYSRVCAPVRETGALVDVAAERRRQIEAEGWTPEHDDEHDGGEMALAAARYAAYPVEIYADMEVSCGCRGLADCPHLFPPTKRVVAWPWDKKWWKPKDERRNLVKAAALILAEIERIDRKSTVIEGQKP